MSLDEGAEITEVVDKQGEGEDEKDQIKHSLYILSRCGNQGRSNLACD